ncbi:MAG: TlyA family rRNA (cytidine-2'-O)-methyltransferase [Helicobacteraceae bacterium]|nr:TlyA family rRNA (cytidine-2'-O)-methyltransferase [Helicobacteraceae bacterium]
MRLDKYLQEHDFVDSRNKAQTLIKDEKVLVNSKVITKVSFDVNGSESIEVHSEELYVSRSALKLKSFLASLPFKVKGLEALDIGASTGGFSEVLLEESVKSVVCVDVGSGQLHTKIKEDPRVENFESTDIRNFTYNSAFNLVVSDVSFISLLKILDDVDRVATKWIILLFKPQFEVGREVKRDKNGVIKDKKAIASAMLAFEDVTLLKKWTLILKEEASIKGKEGNVEYCYCFKKD